MALGRKTGGRQPGTRNKATREIKAAFQKHGDELVGALLALTKDKDPRVRLAAVQAALDRGWGRPSQAVDLDVEVQITAIERKIIGPEVIEHEGGCRETERRLRICTFLSAQIPILKSYFFENCDSPPYWIGAQQVRLGA